MRKVFSLEEICYQEMSKKKMFPQYKFMVHELIENCGKLKSSRKRAVFGSHWKLATTNTQEETCGSSLLLPSPALPPKFQTRKTCIFIFLFTRKRRAKSDHSQASWADDTIRAGARHILHSFWNYFCFSIYHKIL